MVKVGIKSLIIMLFVITGLIPMLVLGLFSLETSRTNIEQEIFKQNSIFFERAASDLNDFFKEGVDEATFISEMEDVIKVGELSHSKTIGSEYNDLRKSLTDLLISATNNSDYSIAFITDSKGKIIVASRSNMLNTYLGGKPYMTQALSGISKYNLISYSSSTDSFIQPVAVPITSNGTVVGTVNIAYDVSDIDRIVHNGLDVLGEHVESYLVSSEGLYISNMNSSDDVLILKEVEQTKEIASLMNAIEMGETSFRSTEITENSLGQSVLSTSGVVTVGNEQAALIVQVDEDEALSSINTFTVQLMSVIIGLLTLGVLLSIVIILLILKPIKSLTDIAEKVSSGNNQVDLSRVLKRKDALGKLAVAFDHVVKSNEVKVKAIDQIASGNFEAIEVPEDSLDPVYDSIWRVVSNFNEFTIRIDEITKQIKEGKYLATMNMSGMTGQYLELLKHFEGVIDTFSNQFKTLSQPMFTIDREFNIQFVNEAVERIMGETSDTLINSKCYDKFKTDHCQT